MGTCFLEGTNTAETRMHSYTAYEKLIIKLVGRPL